MKTIYESVNSPEFDKEYCDWTYNLLNSFKCEECPQCIYFWHRHVYPCC